MIPPVAIAIGAHPDDIEFQMAGTLLLLREAGFRTHYLNLCHGNCGSLEHNGQSTRKIRAVEARAAARILGAEYHPGWVNDLELVYDLKNLRRLAAILREVQPGIVLTHSPRDYMEDHTTTCRLAVTAAFARGMPNFRTVPVRQPYSDEVVLYHCPPHGLRDGLREKFIPGAFVNTTGVHEVKLRALAAHQSQQHWLDASQGMNSYLGAMTEMAVALGRSSGKFTHAEGWRRHLHLGFTAADHDPLAAVLGRTYRINRQYEKQLEG